MCFLSLSTYAFPLGYKEEEFNWQSYLKTCKAQAAPKSLFENQNIVSVSKVLFLSGGGILVLVSHRINHSDNKEL